MKAVATLPERRRLLGGACATGGVVAQVQRGPIAGESDFGAEACDGRVAAPVDEKVVKCVSDLLNLQSVTGPQLWGCSTSA